MVFTVNVATFPISRDPPEGGTLLALCVSCVGLPAHTRFQFLGIPPKGERLVELPYRVQPIVAHDGGYFRKQCFKTLLALCVVSNF